MDIVKKYMNISINTSNNLIIVILSPTFLCNAICKHCGNSLYNSKYDDKILSPEELYISVKNVLNTFYYNQLENCKIYYVFHGGEPLLLGTKYIENFIKLNKDIDCIYSIQTNMLLYTHQWKNIFSEYNFTVNTSYDFFTDVRKLPSGEDYYSIWYKRIQKYIQDTGKKIKTVVTLNKKNMSYIEDIIDIAHELNIDLELNCMRPSGRAIKNYNNNFLTPEEYGMILCKAYTYGQKYEDMIIRYGHDIKNITKQEKKYLCPFTRDCINSMFMIDPLGNMHKCPTAFQFGFSDFGNALTNQLDRKKFLKFKTITSIPVEKCYDCDICFNGGCPIDRIEKKILIGKEGTYCISYKMLYQKK